MSEQRLIDASKMYTNCENCFQKNLEYCDHFDLDEWLNDQPTIDLETLPIVRELRESAARWGRYCARANRTIRELREKLARYEKAEQEGKLVIVPDKLYDLYFDEFSPEKWCITEYKTEGGYIAFAGDYIAPDEIGKIVFLTREEAEAALIKERENHGS